MKENTKYNLTPSGHNEPVGFFLNSFYYGHPFGDDIKQGKVDADGNVYSFIRNGTSEELTHVAVIKGSKYIRILDGAEFDLQENIE